MEEEEERKGGGRKGGGWDEVDDTSRLSVLCKLTNLTPPRVCKHKQPTYLPTYKS